MFNIVKTKNGRIGFESASEEFGTSVVNRTTNGGTFISKKLYKGFSVDEINNFVISCSYGRFVPHQDRYWDENMSKHYKIVIELQTNLM